MPSGEGRGPALSDLSSFDPSSIKRRLLSGGAWAVGGKLGATVAALLSNVLLARLLSPQDFGSYLLIVSVVSVGSVVACMGLNNAAVRFVAESMGLDKVDRARRAVVLVLALGCVGALGVGLAYGLGIGGVLADTFGVPELATLAGFIAGWIIVATAQELFAETFRGFHDVRAAVLLGGMAIGGSAGLVMRAMFLVCLAGLWFAAGKTSIGTIMLIVVGSGSVAGLLSGLFLRAKVKSLRTSDAPVPGEVPGEEVRLKEIFGTSLPLLVNNLVLFVLVQADLWIIAAFMSPTEVAVYGAASRLMLLVTMPLMVVNAVMPPVIAGLYARGEKGRLQRTVRPVATLTLFPALLALGAFAVAGGPILGFLYGDFYAAGALVLALLSLGKLSSVWAGSCGLTLQMTGQGRLLMSISILSGTLFVGGALLAVQGYGMVGVASVAAGSIAFQNLAMVLAVRVRTGIWTHAAFSVAPLRKVVLTIVNGGRT